MSSALLECADHIQERYADWIFAINHTHGELTVVLKTASVADFVRAIRTDPLCRFSTLVDITAVDYLGREPRFDVVYHVLSMHKNMRIRLKAPIDEGGTVPSVVDIHPCANWFEREVFDMFGIVFSGHSDLRRILTDYGFDGHPLRKDFPTTGYTEVRYDEEQKQVIYEPVRLVQEYRQFDFMSPWQSDDAMLKAIQENTKDNAVKSKPVDS